MLHAGKHREIAVAVHGLARSQGERAERAPVESADEGDVLLAAGGPARELERRMAELVGTKHAVALREGADAAGITLIDCGLAAGAKEVMEALTEELAASGRKDIRVVGSGCMGMCSSEPNVTVEMLGNEGVLYKHMDKNKMRQVFKRHVLLGEVQTDFALARIK